MYFCLIFSGLETKDQPTEQCAFWIITVRVLGLYSFILNRNYCTGLKTVYCSLESIPENLEMLRSRMNMYAPKVAISVGKI